MKSFEDILPAYCPTYTLYMTQARECVVAPGRLALGWQYEVGDAPGWSSP